MLEMQTALATIYQRFETSLLPQYVLQIDNGELSLKAPDGLPVYVTKRKM
jgi:hypothetical protein